jgi:hypothetical protein
MPSVVMVSGVYAQDNPSTTAPTVGSMPRLGLWSKNDHIGVQSINECRSICHSNGRMFAETVGMPLVGRKHPTWLVAGSWPCSRMAGLSQPWCSPVD